MTGLAPLVGGTSGPWVTFIPGIGNDASFWRRHAEDLAQDFRVLRFDPWGCGDSGPAPTDCSIDDVTDGIVGLWDRLGIERSSVVGLGFGGSTALKMAIGYPDRVTSVVACCCRSRQPDDRRQFWRDRHAFARQHGLRELADITVDRWLRPEFRDAHPDVAHALRNAMLRNSVDGYCAYVNAFAEMDFTGDLGRLTAPTLLIAAEHDHGGGPVGAMRALLADLPTARLDVIADCGHICNYEAPTEVARLLRDHLCGT